MKEIVSAALSDDAQERDFESLEVPDSYRGAVVLKEETAMFAGMASSDKDPGKSVHIQDVPTPEPGPGEALIAVMASSVNYNTVWSALFEPLPTFGFLERYARSVPGAEQHDQPFHVLGSDLSGVVLRTGPGVSKWKAGDRVVAHCLSVELESPDGHDDTMLDPAQRIWGFETNYGGLAELALVKTNQLMPKPAHLTWEEAACSGLVNSTAHRQLVSRNGAGMKQGDVVLIWGAGGGLGSYATQLALNGGAVPVCVVSSEEKARLVRAMGAEHVINRATEGYRFWKDETTQDTREWRRFGSRIRELTGGEDPDIVLEHPGRETFGASVYVARRGGTFLRGRHCGFNDAGTPFSGCCSSSETRTVILWQERARHGVQLA
ncbi:crotonyl-CoA carboxylase/reductase [Streptomyces sp. NPDC005989]|uniref:crotonyl-CoA carboxylase/reductase n=1 Tax=Streptomyces sp. NPDC005989 TaxID=3156727 RepID=UPI0034074DC2